MFFNLQNLTATYKNSDGEEVEITIASHADNGYVYYTFVMPVRIVGISLSLEDRVEMNYYVKAETATDLEGLSLVITYCNRDGETVREVISSEKFLFDGASGYYKVNFSSLNATDMRTVVTARLENEEGQVMSNTRTYSIESYASSGLSHETTSQVMKDLLIAMIKYGDSTASFFLGA